MGIKKSFNGASISKPGAYSKDKVDNSAGSALASTNVMFIVGESSLGAPGSVTGITQFNSANIGALIAQYGSGPIVDCAIAAIRPSKTPGQAGAGVVMVYKTNASTQASAMIKKSTSNIFQVSDAAWGKPGNSLALVVAAGDTGSQKNFSVTQIGGTTESLGQNPAQNVLSIRYTGDATTAVATIAGSTQAGKSLVTVLAGDQTDGSVALNVPLNGMNMAALVQYINAHVGYSASISTVSLSVAPATQLDPITASNIKPSAVQLQQLQYEMLAVLNSSKRIKAVIQDVSVVGVPDNGTTMLSGGAQGASTNSSFSQGFAVSLAQDYNVMLPAVSRDATTDIADANQGFTDASSTYTIASVLAAQVAHLQLRGDTKNRLEAQGFAGFRNASKAQCYTMAQTINSYLEQLCIQDCLVLNAQGSLTYMHPHVTAALAAGTRAGQETGEPLTHKYPNVNQVGHFINPLTGLEAGDFNAGLDCDDAIAAGILFLEKAKAGYRWVVDNTTYGIDDSFVYNRGSVVQACQFVDRTLRQTAEDIFVGGKVSNGVASSIKSAIRNKLRELNAPDVNIITSSSDAPEGFREDTFVVTVNGNTAVVQVEYKPVQGLDFVFFEFTLGDIQQTA
jgi:hypothetical protein